MSIIPAPRVTDRQFPGAWWDSELQVQWEILSQWISQSVSQKGREHQTRPLASICTQVAKQTWVHKCMHTVMHTPKKHNNINKITPTVSKGHSAITIFPWKESHHLGWGSVPYECLASTLPLSHIPRPNPRECLSKLPLEKVLALGKMASSWRRPSRNGMCNETVLGDTGHKPEKDKHAAIFSLWVSRGFCWTRLYYAHKDVWLIPIPIKTIM